MRWAVLATAILVGSLACAGMHESPSGSNLVTPSLVLGDHDVGSHTLLPTNRRAGMKVDLVRGCNGCEEMFSLYIRSDDGKTALTLPIILRNEAFQAIFIDLTGDGVEEVLLTSVVAHGSDGMSVEDLQVYALGSDALIPLGSTGYRQTAGDTEWKYEISYPQKQGQTCPTLRLIMKKREGDREVPAEAESNIGPVVKELSFCGSGEK